MRLEKSMTVRVEKLESDITTVKEKLSVNEDKIEGLEYDVGMAKEDITRIENEEVAVLKGKYEHLKQKLTLMEINNRKYNLLFYGVEQTQNENINEVLQKCWKDDFGLTEEEAECVVSEVTNAHRLPSREARRGPDPIIVRFCYMGDLQMLLEKGRTRPFMRDRTPATVYTDLPPEMKKLRGELAAKAKDLRRQGNQTRIRVIRTKVFLEFRERPRRGERGGLWTLYS